MRDSASARIATAVLTAALSVPACRAEAEAANPIAQENALPGNSDWALTWEAAPGVLEAYAGATSVQHGDAIDIHARADGPHQANWKLFRMGYYQGLGGRLVASGGPVSVGPQPTPAADPTTGLVECRWPATFTVTTDPNWTSGVYLLELIRDDGPQTYAVFVVRADERKGVGVFQSSATTWQAYNFWGGESLYGDSIGLPGGRAKRVSFNRPYEQGGGAGQFTWFEQSFVLWAESRGYDLTYLTDVDVDQNPRLLTGQKIFLSVGHDEYWSKNQRDGLVAALASGVSAAFFSANDVYRQIRLAPSPVTGAAARTETCYKDLAPSEDPLAGTDLITVDWRDPPLDEPENALIGIMYEPWELANSPWIAAGTSSWVYAGTGMKDGDSIPLIVGYEADRTFSNGRQPAGLQILASDPAIDHTGGPSWHNASVYPASGGGFVFAAGTIDWSWGLSLSGFADPRVQKMTDNVLEHAGLVPATDGDTFGAGTPPPVDLTRLATQVVTLAGRSSQTGWVDGPASSALFDRPIGIAADAAGNVYVGDTGNHVIREIAAGSHVVSTIAGVGKPGTADGPGPQMGLYFPEGLAAGGDGALYVADTGNNRIVRMVQGNPWMATTFAGSRSGDAGRSDGQGTSALFFLPTGVAAAGDALYVTDTENDRICRIDAGGNVTTIAGGSGEGWQDGPGASAQFYRPTGIAAGDGALWVVDTGNRTIRKVALDGAYTVTTLAGSGVPGLGQGGFADGPAQSALFMPLSGIADAAGSILVADTGNERIRIIRDGTVGTYAGSGAPGGADGSGAAATFSLPVGAAVLPDGTVAVADEGDSTVRLVVGPVCSVQAVQGRTCAAAPVHAPAQSGASAAPPDGGTGASSGPAATRSMSCGSGGTEPSALAILALAGLAALVLRRRTRAK